jgi:hypothetical protein
VTLAEGHLSQAEKENVQPRALNHSGNEKRSDKRVIVRKKQEERSGREKGNKQRTGSSTLFSLSRGR